MTKLGRWGWAGVLAGLALAASGAGSAAGAQETIPPPRLGLVAGAFSYDLQGEGTTAVVGVRLDLPVLRHLAMEAGVHYASYRAVVAQEEGPPARPDVPLVMGDFQAQLRWPLGELTPFVGLGAGGVMDLRDDREAEKFVELTYTAGAGVRVPLRAGLEVFGEARLRGIGEVAHHVTELLVGLELSL